MQRFSPGFPATVLEQLRMRRQRAGQLPMAGNMGEPGVLVASYNVHKCVGTDGRFDPERTFRVIHEIDADVVALQEPDRRVGNREGLLDLARLEHETGLALVPVSGNMRTHGWHGNVLLFRRGVVRDVHQIALPGLEPRGAIVAELELETGSVVKIIAAHFGLLRRSRTHQARLIQEIMNARDEVPALLMGDLNEWTRAAGCLQDFDREFSFADTGPSFHARRPVGRLDRIMVSSGLKVVDCGVHASYAARKASDHLPIWADIAAT